MPFRNYMSKEEMASVISALEQALYMHEQWTNHLYSSLICRLPPDERDLVEAPHHRCPFGQWYYAHVKLAGPLSQHPGFVALSAEYEQLHRIAARMLITSQVSAKSITVREYDGFVNTMGRLRSEILDLKHEFDEALTNLDPLTGAMSRIGMFTKLRTEQQMVKRNLHPCTIAMMDLDLFKDVNDQYGHQVGDIVLTETVRYAMTHLRPYDEFFRYGGEEFLLCAPGTNLETGYDVIERLCEGLAATPIDVGDGRMLRVTASFGVTLLDPDVPVEESIARADQALYKAKASGRNQARMWDPSIA